MYIDAKNLEILNNSSCYWLFAVASLNFPKLRIVKERAYCANVCLASVTLDNVEELGF